MRQASFLESVLIIFAFRIFVDFSNVRILILSLKNQVLKIVLDGSDDGVDLSKW